MNYDYIFDGNSTIETEYKLDCKDGNSTCILFENEHVVLSVDTHGNAVFSGIDKTEIKKETANSNQLFSKVFCFVKDNKIIVRFPITKTIDHYPHCDGEYDRYSEVIVDNIFVTCDV